MTETVFKKMLSLLLCAVLLLGALPLEAHAEEPAVWYFPLPEEYFDDITDYAGCRGQEADALYGVSNPGCTHPEHSSLAEGSSALLISVPAGAEVYAPVGGTLYRSGQPDAQWGNLAVIEYPAGNGYSYYILLGNLSAESGIGSGSSVPAGSLVALTAGGELRLSAVMDVSGRGEALAANPSTELSAISGWLTQSEGTGLVCMNPSRSTSSQYSNPLPAGVDGPVVYSFVPSQAEQPTEHTHAYSDQWSYNETDHWHQAVCEHPGEMADLAPHTWDEGVTSVEPTPASEGTVVYTCTVCGATKTQTIPPIVTEHTHSFDQQIAEDRYLVSSATCSSPAMYYKSCICGETGTETFSYGEAAPHTYSDQWSSDENNHWHQATCEHQGEVADLAPHTWDGGAATAEGSMLYTCTTCGATKTEAIAHTHSFVQQNVSEAYLASPATCSGPATYFYSCECGAMGTETFPYGEAAGHTYSDQWSSNENNHWHQAVCEHQEEVADLAPHTWGEGVTTVSPTHTTNGEMTYTCTVCGATRTEDIAATPDHVFDQEIVSDAYLASPATCSGPAVYYKSCICGEKGTETFSYGEAAPHTYSNQWSSDESNHWRQAVCAHSSEVTDFGPHKWDEGVITKNAGHVTDGEKVYTCLTCGAKKTEVLPGQPHEFNQQIATDAYLASPATCTSPAAYYYSCVCGEKGTETFLYGEAKGHTYSDQWSSDERQHWQAATCEHTGEKRNAADHTWSPGQITLQPTATTKGVMTYTCTVCGRTKTEEVEPTQHQHTFSTTWTGNSTYHWHSATCEHTSVVSGLGEHSWNEGTITVWPTHTTAGQKTYTCQICGMSKTEAIAQTHTFDQQIASSAYLASNATCTSPATYYYSCSCGAKGTETFSFGSALGHVASSVWGKDANYHWSVCSRCGAKGELTAHTYDTAGKCTVCGYSKEDAHVHSSHLSRVPAKAATCTQPGNIAYYVCDCGMWFTDVTTTTAITDQNSVVLPALGHVDADNNGRCDVCKERLDNLVEYQVTEGAESTWLNTSSSGLVFRSNSDYASFDRVEVDGATVSSENYSVSQGSTIVELNASYLKRLTLGYHTVSIVAKDGKASTGFTIKQGAATGKTQSGGNGPWGIILFLTVVIAIAIPVILGILYYRKRMSGGRYAS